MPAKSGAAVAREKKQTASLAGWRKGGTQTAAAKACGVCETTIRNWHREYPKYREAVKEAIDEFAATVGQSAHAALADHIEAAARGDMVLTKQGVEAGKTVELHERVALNPALARLALTRADPRFTHPRQQVEHSGQIQVDAALDEAIAKVQGGSAEGRD